MKNCVIGDKLYYVSAANNLVEGIIEKDLDATWWIRFTIFETNDGHGLPINKDDTAWLFRTPLEAIGSALHSINRDLEDALNEVAIAQVARARLESLYIDQGEKL